jgi:hypothetical protein
MSAAARVLELLPGARQTGPGRWICRCPAHEDCSPSLSLREADDGRVLIHCFGGCPTLLVLQALGLDFGDLFEKPLAHHLPPIRGGFSARELLELNAHEALVAAMLSTKAGDEGLTEDEAARLRMAAARLTKAKVFSHGT